MLSQGAGPIAYLSKVLGVKNMALSTYEKEFLAVLMAVEKWKHYFQGSHFIIKTGQQSLKHLLEQIITSALQHKWASKLLGLDYEISYIKGVENKAADALSRKKHETDESSCATMSQVQPQWITDVQLSYKDD